MRRCALFPIVLIVLVLTVGLAPVTFASDENPREEASGHKLTKGWVIGNDGSGTATILHTRNGGKTWRVQGNNSRWTGFWGNDISAVDGQTAWAALGSTDGGKILHTKNGGAKWVEQQLPEGVGEIKGIKGLSRRVAWAVGINGTVLHTTNGGKLWSVVPHDGIFITQVNRLDAMGVHDSDVWMVDEQGGRSGMIHTQDNGKTWRQEWVDYPDYAASQGLHMVCAYSRSVVWCAAWDLGILYRTVDGGDTWEDAGTMSGPNDVDDMCSPTADSLWAVQNLSGGSGGLVFHVRIEGGQLIVEEFHPTGQHIFEGVTCSDDLHAVVVGSKSVGADPSLPMGVILATKDGGKTWSNQPTPVDDVAFWKVSFVGARW